MVENDQRITVFNSRTLCGPHRYMVEHVQEMKEKSSTAEETESFLIPQDFSFLKRGGGQPIKDGEELAEDRSEVLYGLDKISTLRFSHENPSVLKCYQDYLGAPLSHLSHELLHTDHHAWKMPGEEDGQTIG